MIKKKNPQAAWRESRRKILDFFETDDQKFTWTELWNKAKSNGMNYNTLKSHMKDLTSTNVVQQELDSCEIPAVIKYSCNAKRIVDMDVIYSDGLVSFIEERNRNLNNVFLAEGGEVIITDSEGKEIVNQLKNELLKLRLRLKISDVWEKTVLSKYPTEQKKIITKYAQVLIDYIWIHQKYKKEDIINDMKNWCSEIIMDEERFKVETDSLSYSAKSSQKIIEAHEISWKHLFHNFREIEEWKNSQIKMPVELRDYSEPSEEKELKEKKKLEEFLIKHEQLYEEFFKKTETEPKLTLIVPSFSFLDSQDKFRKAYDQLPIEVTLSQYEGQKKRALTQEIQNFLKKFDNKSTLFRCNICGQIFDKRKKAENHVKYDEKKLNAKEIVQTLDKQHYQEMLSFLGTSH